MWFVEWLLSILTYPIEWFWDKASVYKEEGKKGRVILLFALSLSGVVLFGYALIYGCIWIWYNHIEIVIIGGLIIWLYSYVYSKCVKKQEAQVDLIKLQQENEIEIQARRDYPLLKMLLYRTLKGSADSIGSKPPINVNEIVFQDKPFLTGCEHYFKGDECYDGVMEYYDKFSKRRKKRDTGKRMLLIYDEYPSSILYYGGNDKRDKTKKATEITNAIAEMLMLGRGIKVGVWIVTQRADASLFANGSRDSFMVILGMGRMSREQKGMIFAGEDIPDKVYHQGEGCLLADGYPLYEVKIPRIRDMVDWKKHIKQVLLS